MEITLKPVTMSDAKFLYDILVEREENKITDFNENIIPSFTEHEKFIQNNPYQFHNL